MTITETTIKVPEEMLMYLHPETETEILQRNAMILYPYVYNGTISHGRAAEILGIKKRNLIELYNEIGFPYLSNVAEYDKDLRTIEKIKEKL